MLTQSVRSTGAVCRTGLDQQLTGVLSDSLSLSLSLPLPRSLCWGRGVMNETDDGVDHTV